MGLHGWLGTLYSVHGSLTNPTETLRFNLGMAKEQVVVDSIAHLHYLGRCRRETRCRWVT
jgi:hypothetical protein